MGGKQLDPSVSAITRVEASDLDEVVAVHREAFRDYPTMRWVLGDAGADYAARLSILIGLFVDTMHLKGGLVFGARSDGELVAAADAVRSDSTEPPEVDRRREATWASLGLPARERYERYSVATSSFEPERPCYYLSMLGVHPRFAGCGLARPLVDEVQALSRADPATHGVYLETEDRRNVGFYRHLGFELTGHVQVAESLESWGFFRAD